MNAIYGGVLIGAAVSLMLILNGRVVGISGILAGILKPQRDDLSWRVTFVGGLLAGGLILGLIWPVAFVQVSSAQWFDYAVAGLLVGFGTLLGNGCTSGHGVCGLSRFSLRSLIATLAFIVFGIVSVLVFKMSRGSL